MYCQMFSTGLISGARDGSKIGRDVVRHIEAGRNVPSSALHEQNGVRSAGDVAGYLVEVELHGFGIGLRQRKRGGAARRTDGAEQIGIFVALVGRLSRSRTAPGPLPDDAVLLADPGFILEPDFDRGPLGHVRQMHEKFFCKPR